MGVVNRFSRVKEKHKYWNPVSFTYGQHGGICNRKSDHRKLQGEHRATPGPCSKAPQTYFEQLQVPWKVPVIVMLGPPRMTIIQYEV